MTMQSDNRAHAHGLSNNLWAQMGLLAAAVIILLAIASLYVW
ncbi:MAG: hypothetical protein WA322_17520 [Pseudolabrys sp.]